MPLTTRWFAVTSLACLLAGMADPQERQEKENGTIEPQRQEWFYSQRAYPRQYVPGGARVRAFNELRTKQAAESAAAKLSGRTLAPPAWSAIGPQPINTPFSDPVVSGRITAIAIDPANSSHVFVAGAQGGVWRTVDGGGTWTPLTDNQPTMAIGSLALDPTNANIVYAGTGEENFGGDSYYGAGILKSTDGGSTWAHYCGPFCGPVGPDGYYGGGARIGGLSVHPVNNQVLLAAVALLFADGVYRSTDGGVNWTQVLSGNPGTAVLFDPVKPNTAYAALGSSFTGGTEGVYKSTDGGVTWAAMNGSGATALPLANAGRIVLAQVPSNTSILYASIASSVDGSLVGMFKTTNGGGAWTKLTGTPDYCTPQCNYDNAIAVAPTSPNVVYAGGAFFTTLIRSLNGGATWTVLQSAQNFGFVHSDVHALAFAADSSKLYLGCDGGMYSTTQVAAANPVFTALNSTLATAQFYPGISIAPGNPSAGLGGTQDNGTVSYSGSLTWNQLTCGDGGYTAIDFTNPSTFYAACQEIFVQKSTAGGANGTWVLSQAGIDTTDRVDFIPPMVMDPSNSSTLYFGTYRVYQTKDGAGTWTAISPDLTNGPAFWGIVTTIAVAPSDANTVYAGTGDSRVQLTTNAGAGAQASWTDVSTGLPPRIITRVAVDPATPATAYVTFSGFTGFGDTLGHIFRTTNKGQTWTDISATLPNTPINSLVIHPNNRSALFVGTDVGVFYSLDAGAVWTSLMNGLPAVAVLGLAVDKTTNTLRAATYGRSAWDLNTGSLIGPPAISLTPASLTFAVQVMGTTSAAKPVTLTNTGTVPLTVSIAASGDFSQTNTCGAAVAPGSACTLSVTFKPRARGNRTGTLTVTDNAAGSPNTVALTGVGTAVNLAPKALQFSATPVGTQTAPKNVKLTNVSSNALSITGIAIGGVNPADFSQANNCGTGIDAGAFCTISVKFKPTAVGTRGAALSISDNGGGSPHRVNLSGTGN